MSTATALRFHREHGNYYAKGTANAYTISRNGRGWLLQVRPLTETAGVRHSLGQPVIATDRGDRKAEVVAVARAYEALGEDYRMTEHGGRHRMTQAISNAYEGM